MDQVEQVDKQFNVKNKNKKAIIIGGIIAAVVIIALVLVYFLIFAKPQFVFNTAIDKLFKAETKKYDTVKTDIKLKVSGEMEDDTVQENFDEISKLGLILGGQLDTENKIGIVNLGLQYDKEELVEASVGYKDKKIYANIGDLYDNKWINIDNAEEAVDSIEEVISNTCEQDRAKNGQKAMKMLGEEIKTQLNKEGKFSKQKVTEKINGKEEKLTKSTVSLTEKQYFNVLKNVLKNLAKNDKFLECYEDKEEQKEILNNTVEALESNYKINEDATIKISIYTKGIFKKFKGVSFEITASGEKGELIVLKENENSYAYSVKTKSTGASQEVVSGTIKIEKETDKKDEQEGKVTITINVNEIGKIKLEANYSVKYNDGIDGINTKNSVKITEMTEEDTEYIYNKLIEKPLIGDIITSIGSTSNLSNTNTNSSFNDDLDFDTNNVINTTSSTSTQSNQVKNSEYLVTFSNPSDFKYDSTYSTDSYKYLEKGDYDSGIDATVKISWGSIEDSKEDAEWDYDYYKEDTFYKNVSLGNEKTIKVGNNEFVYQILSYESNSTYSSAKYQKAYVWYKLDDDYTFEIELDATNSDISEDIIKGFLNISVSKVSN